MIFRPSSLVLLPVSHIQQRFSGECLAACAAMVLSYLDAPLNYEQLVKLFQIRRPIGTPFFKIRELEKQRIHVIYKQGSLQALYNHLTEGTPCIVDVETRELPYWQQISTRHVVVVVGMDNEYAYLNDPEFSNAPVRVSIGDFDLAWLARDERYAILIP